LRSWAPFIEVADIMTEEEIGIVVCLKNPASKKEPK